MTSHPRITIRLLAPLAILLLVVIGCATSPPSNARASTPGSYSGLLEARHIAAQLEFPEESRCEQFGYAMRIHLPYDHKSWWRARARSDLRRALMSARGGSRECNWVASDTFEKYFPSDTQIGYMVISSLLLDQRDTWKRRIDRIVGYLKEGSCQAVEQLLMPASTPKRIARAIKGILEDGRGQRCY